MDKVRAKKHLGQHFLRDENIAQKIVESMGDNTTPVLEIGPGMGVLTKYAIHKNWDDFKVIELDSESVIYLKKHLLEEKSIVEGDFLKVNTFDFYKGEYRVLGNFPYNISSQIFFKILQEKDRVTEVVGMLQKEVAERITANPGNKIYGILSVLLGAFYDMEYLFTVKPGAFDPPPKVNSGVIKLVRNNTVNLPCSEKLFFRVVKTGFNNRRKTLWNALKPLNLPAEIREHEAMSKRAEQLSVNEFIALTKDLEVYV